MNDTITITLREYGERTVTFDRAEYEQAKADNKLDHLLDHDASDMDTTTVVIEPDGTEVHPWGH